MVPTIKYMSQRNLRAASLALLLFLYPIVALSFFSIRYMETVHRVTMSKVFDVSLFGSIEADSLAAIGFGLLFLGFSSHVRAAKLVFVAIFAVAVAGYAGDRPELVIGALVIGPVITGLLAIAAMADRKDPLENRSQRLPFDGKRVAGAFLLIVIIIEAGAVGRWIAYPATGGEIYSDPSWKLAELESALFHSLGLLSPVLVVLLAFSFLYRWYILNGIRRVAQAILPAGKATDIRQEREFVPPQRRSAHNSPQDAEHPVNSNSSQVATFAASNALTSKHLHRWLLALALVVAPLLMIYPHLPTINPGGEAVSADEVYYTNWMTELRSAISTGDQTWWDTLLHAFTVNNGDRPITLILILAISNLTGYSDLMVIRFLPVVLAPALVSANYFLLKHTLDVKHYGINRVKVFAAIGSVLAVFSPQIVVGEYAGLLANWIALTVAYFVFYLLIKGWESSVRTQYLGAFCALFAALLLTMSTHLYTWTYLLAVIVIFAGLSYLTSRKSIASSKTKTLLMLIIVFTSFSIDYAKSLYFNTSAATEADSALASNIQANDPGGRWDRLNFTMSALVGGFLSNPALFLLSLVWVVKAKPNGLNILLLSMIYLLAVPAAIGSVEFQARVFHNTPIHIAALLALMWTGGQFGRQNEDKLIQKLLVVVVILVMATFALRAMANLPLVLPPGYQLG
jgi:hypothetical protein